jgi:hypothetical protein
MTCMEINAVRPNGDVTLYGEAQNSWGGAMHIWLTLANTYGIPMRFSEDGFKQLWGSIDTMSIPDQWVMASTFDMCIIAKEQLPTLIKHWQAFYKLYPKDTLKEGIAILRKAAKDSSVQGVCFNQTSVVDSWSVATDTDEGSRPYNVNQDTGHWYLTPEYLSKGKRGTEQKGESDA